MNRNIGSKKPDKMSKIDTDYPGPFNTRSDNDDAIADLVNDGRFYIEETEDD